LDQVFLQYNDEYQLSTSTREHHGNANKDIST
jgi:hypothetical protein